MTLHVWIFTLDLWRGSIDLRGTSSYLDLNGEEATGNVQSPDYAANRTCRIVPVPPTSNVRLSRWSQWVDATLAQDLLVGVYKADFVREG
jgi:hypothetical protein